MVGDGWKPSHLAPGMTGAEAKVGDLSERQVALGSRLPGPESGSRLRAVQGGTSREWAKPTSGDAHILNKPCPRGNVSRLCQSHGIGAVGGLGAL